MKNKINELGGSDGGVYSKEGSSSHYQNAFVDYLRDEEYHGGSVYAYLACVTQMNKYSKRIGVKSGVDYKKDYAKLNWYRTAARIFKSRVDYVDLCIKEGAQPNPAKGIAATPIMVDLLSTQVCGSLGIISQKPKQKLSYNLSEEVEKILKNERERQD